MKSPNTDHPGNKTEVSDDELAMLHLALIPGIGPRMQKVLIETLGSAAAVLRAAPSKLRQVPGIGPQLLRHIEKGRREINPRQQWEFCLRNQVEILHNESDSYPRNLREIFDPPGVLFARGTLESQDDLAIAIVGTRHATNYGLAQARQLAAGLARTGVTIVSGLARGIDAAAHRGALEAGGRTIAVTGSGVLSVYPPEHKELAGDICSQGAVVSESAPLAKPTKGVFPRRNRVISGMSLGVIVVEAANRSGALITASHAVDQNREVFAIPGRVDNRTSRGCHQLLRDGAKLVESPEDVLEELGPLVAPTTTREGHEIRRPGELQLNEQEIQVLTVIQSEPTIIDQVVVESGLPVHRVLSTVSVLEARHLIRRVSGNQVARN